MTTYRIGSSGDGVREVQTLLKDKGYELEADGVYGPITEKAVRDYQTKNSLAVDGVAGDETIGSLRAKTSDASQIAPSTAPTSNNVNVSDTQTAAKDKLSVLQKGYSDPLDETIDTLYDKVLNQKEFKYDPYADPTYNRYAETYKKNAALMSEDAMAQAAALTGGYGSSYGQAVASQAYNAQMSELNDIIPELRQNAYAEWQEDRNRDIENISMLLNERDYERSIFESDRAFDESVRQADRDFAEGQRQFNANHALDREAFDWQKQQYADELEAQALSAGFASYDEYRKAVLSGEYKPVGEGVEDELLFTSDDVSGAREAFQNGKWAGLESYIRDLDFNKGYSEEQMYNLIYRSTGVDQINTYDDAIRWYTAALPDLPGADFAVKLGIDPYSKKVEETVLKESDWAAAGEEYGSYPEYLRRSMLYLISDKE